MLSFTYLNYVCQVHEYNLKCEELNKVVIDVQGERSRLQHDNSEAVRKLNDYQKSIEMAGLDKNKVASQLKDLQTMIDDMTRQKNQAESRVQAAEQRFKTVSIEVSRGKTLQID